MESIPDAIWNAPIEGANLSGATLAAQLGDGPTTLIFTRHLG